MGMFVESEVMIMMMIAQHLAVQLHYNERYIV